MSIGWIAPAALAGIALIALPIAIHLLVRQHARTMAYPSLRFLRATQLAAFRRRSIQDAALLLSRVAIIALAAVALAGPILRLPSRTAGYASRTARAVVLLDGSDAALVSGVTNNAFASAAFRRSTVTDAIADAIRWLDRQPPASREIILAGSLRRGLVSESDVAIIPPAIGVRFVHVAGASPADVPWSVLARRDGSLVRINRAVRFEIDATRVADGETAAVPDDLVSIAASSDDLRLAQAALRAALAAGVVWSDFDRRVVIVWDGAGETAMAPAPPDVRIVRMPVPTPPSAAADAVRDVLKRLSPSPDRFEPVMITPEQLSSWSREPGSSAATAPLADEGDRRWIWAAVLALLALETGIRRNVV